MDTPTQKARLISLGIFNEGLDRLMEIFDIPTLKQRVRDLDRARERMYSVQDVTSVTIDDLTKFLKDGRKRAKDLDKDITALLSDEDENNDKDAEVLQAQLNTLTEEIAKSEEKLSVKKGEFKQNQEAIQYLTTLYDQGVARIKELQSAKKDTVALNQTADALESAKSVTDSSQGFENVGEGILQRNRAAQKRYARVTGTISDAMNSDEKVAQARADIATRKEALKKKQPA